MGSGVTGVWDQCRAGVRALLGEWGIGWVAQPSWVGCSGTGWDGCAWDGAGVPECGEGWVSCTSITAGCHPLRVALGCGSQLAVVSQAVSDLG